MKKSTIIRLWLDIAADPNLLHDAIAVEAESVVAGIENRRRERIDAINQIRPNAELETRLAKQREGISARPSAIHVGGAVARAGSPFAHCASELKAKDAPMNGDVGGGPAGSQGPEYRQ